MRLFSAVQGLADPSLEPNVYMPTVEDISPLAGSLASGTLFALTGDGLRGRRADSSPVAAASMGGDSVVCPTLDMLISTSLENAPKEVEADIVLRPTPK